MKKIKDTIINICLFGVLLLALILVSCNNNKSNSNSNEDIAVVVENKKDSLTSNYDENQNEIKIDTIRTRRYRMKDGTAIVYNLDAKGIAGFDDWADFTVVNYELAEVRNNESANNNQRIRNLNYRMANLRNSIPKWLQTEEVMEDIADIQKEYLELIQDSDISEKEMQENIEELTEQFDDLKEELNETIEKYLEIRKEAIEEFNEEMDKGNYEKALREYDEEIKKLEKLAKK